MRLLPQLTLLLVLLLLVSSGSAQGIYPGIAVRINGEEISYQRFNAFYQEYLREQNVNITTTGRPSKLSRLRREAMDLMVEQELLRQAAEAKAIAVSDGEVEGVLQLLSEPFKSQQDFIRRLEAESYTLQDYREHLRRMMSASLYLEQIRAAVPAVSDAELETYYWDNEYRLTLPEQVRVRHILLTWKPLGTPDDRAVLREQMQTILEQARAGASFAELARTRSEDATAADGGDTGFFHRGQMVPAFEDVAFALQPGEISDIVETPFGLHILQLETRREARLLPLQEIREQLREHVQQEWMAAAVVQETERLRQAAEIEVLIPL
jgi:parvulin-like peptidyl-prolyl isomerase